jgi:hypothetical protein
MDDRQRATLIGFIETEKEKDKAELKLILYDTIKISASASVDKTLYNSWKKAYEKAEKYLKKLIGIDVEAEQKAISDNKFKYKGGRKGFVKMG